MKQCPTCNRTYSDETQSFCLDDGTPLIASYDPEATRVMNPPEPKATRAAPRYDASLTQAAPRTNPALYIAIALLALLVGGGLVALLKSGAISSQVPTSPTLNPAATPNLSSSSPKQASTPLPERREWTVVVPGNVRWLDTGIQAQKGMTLAIQAAGTVTWGPAIANAANIVGPNGTRPPYEQDAASFPIPKAGIGSLVMRIGTVKYAIGANDTVNVAETGTIELMVNDDAVGDNSGSFTVHIRS
jgi:hypothetical protein